jgi:sugar lactone lactonase YvrE
MKKAALLDEALPPSELGEGPFWDAREQLLYWVDITGRRIHRYDPASRRHDSIPTPSMVGFAVLDEAGGIVAGLQDGVHAMDFATGAARPLAAPALMPKHNRFNDGKCDRRGRLWAGTMNVDPDHATPTGALYRYDDRGLVQFEKDIYISNGLGWSPDDKTMYYTDTVRRVIWQYDYDPDKGLPSNRRPFATFEGPGRPDGMTVDSAGRVLTALWPGWGVAIFTPDGKPDGMIDLPVPQAASCVFGGKDLKTLYIVTASVGMTAEALRDAPASGRIFQVEMDIPGLPEARYAGGAR